MPFSSIVRQRRVYSPEGIPGRSAAQWILARRIGQVLGSPASLKPSVPAGILSSASLPPQCSGGERISASIHGAVAKYLSSAGHSALSGLIQTCTFVRPEMPTWPYPVTGNGLPDGTSFGTEIVAA